VITTFDLYVFVGPFLGVTDKIVQHDPVCSAFTYWQLILQILAEALDTATVILDEGASTKCALVVRQLRESILYFSVGAEVSTASTRDASPKKEVIVTALAMNRRNFIRLLFGEVGLLSAFPSESQER